MPDVFTFIEKELLNYSDGVICDDRLRECCLNLNKLLNCVTNQDYDTHLLKNVNAIRTEIDIANALIHEELFVDLSKIVSLLEKSQRDRQIQERDHYYHSIQCFLLAIVLIKNFFPFPTLPKNIVAILFSLTMYHDIGYLYKSINISENEINESFENFFLSNDLLHKDEVERTLCLNTEPYQSMNLITDINETIKNDNSIAGIWKSGSPGGQVLLENDTGLPHFSMKYKSGHAYNSALLLKKILYTKNIIKAHYEWMLKEKFDDIKIEWFKQILKAICLHGLESLSPPLNITNDFYSVYLMIIDELQTYGRNLSSDTHHSLINPKDVGFHWDDNDPKKLVIEIVTTNAKLRKKYTVRDNNIIFAILSKKIDAISLVNIM